MGKKKQKVRWCTLEWSTSDPIDQVSGVVTGKSRSKSSSIPRSVQGWASSLAPRFERKAAAEAEQKHFYHDGEFCESEDLENGFTKIRSKNLDILFKREFYDQRLASEWQICKELKDLKNSESSEDFVEDPLEAVKVTPTHENMGSIDETVATVKSSLWSFDQIDPSKIPEFKPMTSVLETSSYDIDSDNLATIPFFGNYPPPHHPQEYPHGLQYTGPLLPNLYIYSPSTNTLIPCEEISLPNFLMAQERPGYSGPATIYTGCPFRGPEERGFFTQSFDPNSSVGSYSCLPIMSFDSSYSHSSSPHSPSSVQGSASSTKPNSYSPLHNYQPSECINPDQPTLIPHRDYTHTDGYHGPQPVKTYADKLSHLNPPSSVTSIPPAVQIPVAPSATVTHIPGLAPDSQVSKPKKSKNRRKKKTKAERLVEMRGSSSKFVPEGEAVEPINEVDLTDDLANSLVNPPTDPEGSDANAFQQKSSSTFTIPGSLVQENEEKVEKNISCIETNVDVKTTNNAEGKNLIEYTGMEFDYEKVDEIVENEFKVSAKCASRALVNDVKDQNRKDELERKMNAKTPIINIGCNGLPEVPVKAVDENQSESFIDLIEIERDMKVEQGIKGDNEFSQNAPEPGRKPIKGNKLMSKSDLITVVREFPMQNDCPADIEESYSSAIKNNLVKASNNIQMKSSQPKAETVSYSSSLQSNSSCTTVETRIEQENVPLSVSKPDVWEKTSKRKHKNKIIKVEEIPGLEAAPIDECRAPNEVTTGVLEDFFEENANDDEIEHEKKKLRRRKKRHIRQDFQNDNAGHRVIICNEQIEIQDHREVQRAPEVLSTSLLDKVKTSGFGDFVFVRELGSGISRGYMNTGRLFQGKYTPPERTDGFLPIPELDEEVCMEEDASASVEGFDGNFTAKRDFDLD